MKNKLFYILQLADSALIIGHRLGEWCGHGPILEQDIALTNISLDHLGRSRSLYKYAAELFNQLPANEKVHSFLSLALQNKAKGGHPVDEDDLAFLRDAWDFKNLLLVEQENGDWAQTVARSFFFDSFSFLYFKELQSSNDEALAAIATKSLKEIAYHQKWSSEWVIRLGDGTDESHMKMQNAIDSLWQFTGEMFEMCSNEAEAAQSGFGVDAAALKDKWMNNVNAVVEEATLRLPTNSWMQGGGKEGRHTEHLGYILAEMQFMQRTYPDMEW